jgi:predicted HD phosphohydrolase
MDRVIDTQDIVELFARRGHLVYDGEGITQWQHAWQCGQLARRAGAEPTLQLAAWLHDLGHLLHGLEGTPTLRGHDDHHEALAARAEPVALHVEAKRYLVSKKPSYREGLTADSLRSLALQGGAMSEVDCAAFLGMPYAADAIRLRAWDDQGKVPAWLPDAGAESELIALMRSIGP